MDAPSKWIFQLVQGAIKGGGENDGDRPEIMALDLLVSVMEKNFGSWFCKWVDFCNNST